MSLSFSAEQLLSALDRRVLGEARASDWLAALVAQDRSPAEDAVGSDDLDAMLAKPENPSGADTPLTRVDVADRAGLRAADEGREVAGTTDIAAVLLAAVKSPTDTSEAQPVVAAPEEAAAAPPVEEQQEPQPGDAVVDDETERREGSSGRPRTFRVFVSSTFKDLEQERNVLRERVYPELSRFCANRNARFQAIDLRWGVSEEASLDQQAMSICLSEIDRCREITPRPNFLVLLGNRYGWLALPAHIPKLEFERIRGRVSGTDLELLERWYAPDENAVPDPAQEPGEFRLLPRVGPSAPPRHEPTEPSGNGPIEKRTRKKAEETDWLAKEKELRRILTGAVKDSELSDDRRPVYRASATEQEIRAGALGEAPDGGPAFCFIRDIEPADRDRLRRGAAEGDPIRDFVDDPDDEVARALAALKHDLDPFTKQKYEVAWDADTGRPTTDHLEKFAHDVYETLEQAIKEELDDPTPPRVQGRTVRIEIQDHVDPEDDEARAHREFAEERIQDFVGRTELLQQIDDYLTADDPLPLVVHSDGGFGKSALLAQAVHAARGRSGPHLVYRFIGASPESTDGRSLLESLCRELARCDRNGDAEIPSDFQDLTADFKNRLASATAEQPFIVFIDSLDQLAVGQGARRLTWIPQPLPDHVRFVVSTRPGDTFEPLRARIEAADSAPDRLLEVGPLSKDDGQRLLVRWLEGAHRGLQDAQRDAVLDRFESARGNPLYLRLAFEEARRWTSTQAPEDLDLGEPVVTDDGEGTSYPKAVEAIIEHNTFNRLANEENHGGVLVSHALGYLAASRYGLAEDELLNLLSRDPDVYAWFVLNSFHVPLDLRDHLDTYLADMKPELHACAVAWSEEERARARDHGEEEPPSADPEHVDEVGEWVRQLRDEERDRGQLTDFLTSLEDDPTDLQLPVVLWSRFYADLRPYLTERAVEGAIVIDFYHRELRDVAGRCYLPATGTETIAAGTELHSRLADYFRTKADPHHQRTWATHEGEADLRGLSELPYHLTGAERWDDVHDTLTDFTFLEQKVQHVAATTVDHDGEKTTIYRGVFALQEDFDWALARMPGGEGDPARRRRLIVTVTDLGEGLALRCPHCNTSHPVTGTCSVCESEHDREGWKGKEIDCPNEKCKGPLKVNDFIVERD